MNRLCLLLMLALASLCARAQDLDFHAPGNATDAAAAAAMRDLAGRILPVYQENDPERYLSNLSALQMVSGDYSSAYATRQTLRDRRKSADAGRPVGRAVLYDIYAHARAIEADTHVPFPQAFAQAFRDVVPRLNDRDAFALTGWFATPLSALQDDLQKTFDQRRAKGSISIPDAVELIWAYFAFEAYRSCGALVGPLAVEDDRRRYIADDNVQIMTADGAMLSAVLVRPRNAPKTLPALLEVTISDSQNYAREAASHGYVGVVAYARGTHGSADSFVPFQYDGEDAREVINWIAKQPWSNGRVGMYGSGYNGFVAWAAAKPLPVALKAIATSDATAPGIDLPMAGNIFRNSAYRWAFQVMNTGASPKVTDNRVFTDDAQWRAYEQAWYVSGRRYREFPLNSAPHSEMFRRWLNHPSYDRYWQKYVPFREQFAHINIPVLTTTGYYANAQVGALYYFNQHYQYNPHANHTLLVGPYDEGVMQRGPPPVVKGYQVDAAAVVDLRDLRYQWFDYALKGAKKPALLSDRVNYQMMGTNEWRHAPSIEAMGKGALRFYLEGTPADERNRLSLTKLPEATFLAQNFELDDRTDASWTPPFNIISKSLQPHNGEMFVSEPLQQPVELGGLLAAHLDFTVNKQDVDLYVALYELLANGDYLALFDPAYDFRASYARDRVHRHLLRAGVRQQLAFKSERITSRRLQAGSRVVVVLGIDKRPDQQINYGTGDDVSEESIADASVPVKIRWYGGTYIDLPVRK